MSSKNIIEKIKKAGLLGRSGSSFPTGLKWEIVKKAKGKKKYVICNGSEAEPEAFKDKFILENYPQEVVTGIKIALEALQADSAYIYLRKDYYQKFKKVLEKEIGDSPIIIFKKSGGYLAGEETALCETIEGKRPEPRIRPPFPSEVGLWGCPTLVNNVETFYAVSKIARGEYRKTRFYSLGGQAEKKDVYELPEDWTMAEVLKETGNWPEFNFFIQSGGGASGEIFLPQELDQPIKGLAAMIIFNQKETDLFILMDKWLKFFLTENCDKCLPCREGLYRLNEMIKARMIDHQILTDLFFVLKETSFCPFGRFVLVPFESLITKVLPQYQKAPPFKAGMNGGLSGAFGTGFQPKN